MTVTDTLPRGLRIADQWLAQIKAATEREPDTATIERIGALCYRNRPCNDCGAALGQPHDHGCDVERCQYTGSQRIGCGGYTDEHGRALCECDDLEQYDADGYTVHTCGQSPHDCGSQVWDGVWAGYEECVEYGWFTWFEPYVAWHKCGPEHPQAAPDLTRLHQLCDWDQQARRWVQREALAIILVPLADAPTEPA